MMQIVEETPPDDPYYDGFVTPCITCNKGLVLVLPNYPDKENETYSSCNNPMCVLHTPDGPQV